MFDSEYDFVPEFCARYRISPATAYREMSSGRLPYHVVGGRRRIGPQDRRIYLERCARGL